MLEDKISELNRAAVQMMAERGAAALRVENLDRDLARLNAQREALQYALGAINKPTDETPVEPASE